MDPDPKVTELLDELTDIEITKLRQFLHLPLVLKEGLSNGLNLLSTLKTSKEHRPFRFNKALLAIRPELIPSASEIQWLCNETDDNKCELDYEADLLSMKTVIQFLKTEIPKDKWVTIYISITKKAIANMSFAVTMKMLFEKGCIKMDLTFLADIIETVEGKEVADKLRQMDIYFMTMEEDEFKKLFEDAITSPQFKSGKEEGNTRVIIDYNTFLSVYDHKQDSNGLALFVQFDIHYDTNSQCNKICQQMENILSPFSFDFKILSRGRSKYLIADFKNEISKIKENDYRILIVFLIGITAPEEFSHGKLAYFLLEGGYSIDEIYLDDINDIINEHLSQIPIAIPALVFHTLLSTEIHRSPKLQYPSNTFYCFVSHDMNSDVPQLPFVRSLYEVLKYSSNETILLMEFFTEVRDNFFRNFSPDFPNHYDRNTTLFSKNTLRNPLIIKNKRISSVKGNSVEASDGLFFVICCNELDKWEGMTGLIEHIKRKFEAMNYTVGENVMLTNKQRFSQALKFNYDIAKNSELVFVLVITSGNGDNEITFADGNIMGVDKFVYELGKEFPNLPKVLFINKVNECNERAQNKKIQDYQHMLVVHSFENNLSNSSLIRNLLIEIQNNYFDEIHSILRSSIMNSTLSTCIQVIDGLRKKLFNHHHSLIASLLTRNAKDFSENYEKACLKGSEHCNFSSVVLVGPQGAGKTSLLRALIGKPFNINEETTNFIIKHNLKVQKQSNVWSELRNVYEYSQIIEETRQELILKNVARKMFHSKEKNKTECQENIGSSYRPGIRRGESITYCSELDPNPMIVKPSRNPIQFEETQTSQTALRDIGYKSEIITAWDIQGSNDLSCFYPFFLSPKSVYILLIDLTKNMHDVVDIGQNDAMQRRANSLPKTYLQVYEFWLDAIYSVSKTSATEHNNRKPRVIIVFSKADEIDYPKVLAEEYFHTLKVHMGNKNDSFCLVYEEDGPFILSTKRRSKMDMNTLFKLKVIIKYLSDQLVSNNPVPIKWLKLASDILNEKQPILDNSSIHYLAENSQCSEDLPQILEHFHEIVFFFYKQHILIIDIQVFLDLVFLVIFPPVLKKKIDIDNEKMYLLQKDIQVFEEKGRLFVKLFEFIVEEYLNLRSVRELLLDLLQLFGILIICEPEWGILPSFHVLYLQSDSLENLLQQFPKIKLNSTYTVDLPDDFQTPSLYSTLLSECSKRNEEYQLSGSKIGIDCAIFYICDSLIVSFDLLTIPNNILLSFYLCEDELKDDNKDEYINSEILHYLTFLQFTLVKIQNKLIPSGTLAKVIVMCETCNTNKKKTNCTLDTLFLTISNVYNFRSDQSEELKTISDTIPWIEGRFCCESQINRIFKYFYRKDPLFDVIYRSYYNSDLEELITQNQKIFTENLNWTKLARLLYLHGLITIERYSSIVYRNASVDVKSKEYLFDMFHKGPLWAFQFYFTLRFDSTEPKHRYLCDFIDKNIRKGDEKNSENKPLPEQVYLMNKNPHGIAFIVNIETFRNEDHYTPRTGSKCDVVSLKSVFNNLHYQTEIFENLTRKEFLKALKDIRGRNHSKYDSFICVIMSHGNENDELIFSDGKPLSKDKIVREFSSRYCSDLDEKPKIFLFQGCRGTLEEVFAGENRVRSYNVNSQQPASYSKFQSQNLTTINCKDICITNSTIKQYVSYRSEEHGSYFIQSFCNVMASCNQYEFLHIMVEVRRRVMLMSDVHIQCPEDVNRLSKRVYF